MKNNVRIFIITRSGRRFDELMKAAGFSDRADLVNDAIRQFKICGNAFVQGQVLVAFNSATNKATPIDHLDLDATLPVRGMINLVMSEGYEAHFKADFGADDCANLLSDFFICMTGLLLLVVKRKWRSSTIPEISHESDILKLVGCCLFLSCDRNPCRI